MLMFEDITYKEKNLYKMLLIKATIDILQSNCISYIINLAHSNGFFSRLRSALIKIKLRN